jgi:anti-sigma-K factor RskA
VNQQQNRHSHYAEALGAYVLGALDDDERTDVERHVQACERCREDLVELQRAAEVLPRSVPPVAPPGALKDRIMRTVQAEAALRQPAGPDADRAKAGRGRLARRLRRPVLGAAAAALAAGLAGIVVLGDHPGTPSRGRVVAARITDPRLATKAGAKVYLVGDHASLQVQGLPSPPRQRVYQIWLQAPNRSPVPAGTTFTLRSGTVAVRRPLHKGERVMVSVEPEGGSLTPTRPPLIVAHPA